MSRFLIEYLKKMTMKHTRCSQISRWEWGQKMATLHEGMMTQWKQGSALYIAGCSGVDLTVNLTPSVVSLLGLLSFSEISKTVLVKKICERKKNYIHIYTYYKYLLYALMLTCVFFFFSSFYRDRCCSYTRVSNLIHQKKERIGCYNVLAFHC